MKTIVIRHRRENLRKCSLHGLEGDPSLHFLSYPSPAVHSFEGYLLLKVGAQQLQPADSHLCLLLLDATWALAEKMQKTLVLPLEARSLPEEIVTAYPRRQQVIGGLASIEALFVAHLILGRPYAHLLGSYYWRESFLRINRASLLKWGHVC